MSLVAWDQYSDEQLQDQRLGLQQDEQIARAEAGDWNLPSETRRHASERAANCAEMVEEIDAELERRQQ